MRAPLPSGLLSVYDGFCRFVDLRAPRLRAQKRKDQDERDRLEGERKRLEGEITRLPGPPVVPVAPVDNFTPGEITSPNILLEGYRAGMSIPENPNPLFSSWSQESITSLQNALNPEYLQKQTQAAAAEAASVARRTQDLSQALEKVRERLHKLDLREDRYKAAIVRLMARFGQACVDGNPAVAQRDANTGEYVPQHREFWGSDIGWPMLEAAMWDPESDWLTVSEEPFVSWLVQQMIDGAGTRVNNPETVLPEPRDTVREVPEETPNIPLLESIADTDEHRAETGGELGDGVHGDLPTPKKSLCETLADALVSLHQEGKIDINSRALSVLELGKRADKKIGREQTSGRRTVERARHDAQARIRQTPPISA